MREMLVVGGVVVLVLTVALHSWLGERRLIGPLMRERSGVLASPRARFLIRLTWHMVSLTAIALGAVMLLLIYAPDQALRTALILAGVIFTGAGVIDAVATRGTHVGWPFLTGVGLAFLAAFAIAA